MEGCPRYRYQNVQMLGGVAELVRYLQYPFSLWELGAARQEIGLEQLREKLVVSSGGDGSNGRFGAEEVGDLTQVLLESLWLQHGEKYGYRGGRKTQ